MKALLKKIRRILRDRRTRQLLGRIVSATAAVVVFVTTYALVLPAITMETEENCGLRAHQHSDECYDEVLTCGLEEVSGHVHDDSCYAVETVLSCGLEAHVHSDAEGCFDAEGNLICEMEEHQHGDKCYREDRTLVCNLPENEGHIHTAACYEKKLICGLEAHTHSPACYQSNESADVNARNAAVASTESIAVESSERSANGANGADDQSAGIYVDENGLSADAAEGSSSAATGVLPAGGYVPELDELVFPSILNRKTGVYYYSVKDGETVEDSSRITEWKKLKKDAELAPADLLRVYLSYTIPAGSLNETNPTARYRLPSNLHLTDAQRKAINENVNGIANQYVSMDSLEILDQENYKNFLGAEAIEGTRTPDQDVDDYLAELKKSGREAAEYISATVKAEDVYDESTGKYLGTDLVFTFTPYTIQKNRNEYDENGQPVMAGEKVQGWITLDFNTDQVDWEQIEDYTSCAEILFAEKDKALHVDEISAKLTMKDSKLDAEADDAEAVEKDGEETAGVTNAEETGEDSVEESGKDDASAANAEEDPEENEKAESVESGEAKTAYPAIAFDDSVKVSAGTLSTDIVGDTGADIEQRTTLTVHVEADEDTFPEGTTMHLSAVPEEQMGAVSEAVAGAVGNTADTAESETKGFHAVDITFLNRDGEEIEPLKPIRVSMSSENIRRAVEDENTAPVVVHVEDTEGAAESKVSEISNSTDTLTFEAEAFSVYAIVYTVDFHWEVNGKEYDFSIPGGGFVSLTDLVEVLSIIDDKNFVENEEKTDAAEAQIPDDKLDAAVSNAVRKFVADVENVEFSSPELIDVSRVEEDTTIGQIKETRGLQCEYSAELTEEQVLEMNAQAVKGGDWVLISMKPFLSKETLTVTMKNGEHWTVNLTDDNSIGRGFTLDIHGNGGVKLTERIFDGYSLKYQEKTRTSTAYVFPSINFFDYPNNVIDTDITAIPGSGYRFDHWELLDIYGNSQYVTDNPMPAGSISGRDIGTIRAVFVEGSSSTGGDTPSIDFEDLLRQWQDQLIDNNPKVDKTAEVYDYGNRVYKIDISASSQLYAVSQDLDIDFVTDVSRSMLFPSKLESAASLSKASDLITKLDSVLKQRHNAYYTPQSTDSGEYYYIIMKPETASDVYLCRKQNGKWWRLAAGYPEYYDVNPIRGKVGTTSYDPWRELSATDDGQNIQIGGLTSGYYIDKNIYIATDTTQRLVYLQQALNMAKNVLYKVNPDAKIGLTTFADKVYTNRFFNNNEQGQLENAITNITLNDGTNQTAGLISGKQLLDGETDSERKKIAILITDGAPNAANNDWNTIQAASKAMKDEGIDVYTVGLSVENVRNASEGLAATSSGDGYHFDARDGRGLVEAIEAIIESVLSEAYLTGTVSDQIDPAFYPVDKNGNPLNEGDMINLDGDKIQVIPEDGKYGTISKTGDSYSVTWNNQEMGWPSISGNTLNPGWNGTVYVKAKEDFLGGNKIKTNSGTDADQVTVSGYKTYVVNKDGTKREGKSGVLRDKSGNQVTVTKTLDTPHVNVDDLKLTEQSTEWTVYIDSTVAPMTQLKNLYKNVDVSEVVTQSGTDQRMTGSKNPNHDEASETFPLTNITGELSESDWNELLSGKTITIPYGTGNPANSTFAYGHEGVGEIKISLTKTYAAGENKITSASETSHTANAAGEKVEKYSLTVKYVPSSSGASTTYDHVPNGRAGELTGEMTSENKHDITVIRKGIKITKVDMTDINQTLTGATFALYREDPSGTADVSDYKLPSEKKYSLVSDTLTVDENGVVNINPVVPDREENAEKTVYNPDSAVGTDAKDHDTVIYLVEKTSPAGGYTAMPGAIRLTFKLTDGKTDQVEKRSAIYHGNAYKQGLVLYNWTQSAAITGVEEVSNGNSVQYLISDGEDNDLYVYRIKNGKTTDITLIKTDKITKQSIGGAKFSLLKGSEIVDLTELTITAITGGASITPEDYDNNGTIIKVVTVPEGGIRVSGLPDDTYTLREVVPPAGYIITNSGKTFTTENGSIKGHTDEAADINFVVENEPGAALPSTGGPGTTLIYLLGFILTGFTGTNLLKRLFLFEEGEN